MVITAVEILEFARIVPKRHADPLKLLLAIAVLLFVLAQTCYLHYCNV